MFASIRRRFSSTTVTALAGMFVVLFVVIEAICKAYAGPRPPLLQGPQLVGYMASSAGWILASVIADTFVLVCMAVFLAGLLMLAYRRTRRVSLPMVCAAFFTIIYVTVTLIGDSFDAGTALDATQSVGNADIIRGLIEAHIVAFGPIGGIVLAFLAASFATLLIRSHLLPWWTAAAGFIVAVLNIIAIPALFDAYHSWNNQVALVALVSCVVWVGVVSAVMAFYPAGFRSIEKL